MRRLRGWRCPDCANHAAPGRSSRGLAPNAVIRLGVTERHARAQKPIEPEKAPADGRRFVCDGSCGGVSFRKRDIDVPIQPVFASLSPGRHALGGRLPVQRWRGCVPAISKYLAQMLEEFSPTRPFAQRFVARSPQRASMTSACAPSFFVLTSFWSELPSPVLLANKPKIGCFALSG